MIQQVIDLVSEPIFGVRRQTCPLVTHGALHARVRVDLNNFLDIFHPKRLAALHLEELLVSESEIVGVRLSSLVRSNPLPSSFASLAMAALSMRNRPSSRGRTSRQRAGVVRNRPASSSRFDLLGSSVPAIWVVTVDN